MESMRDVLRRNLGRSLSAMSEADRLSAAWPVACGATLAGRAEIVGFDGGIVRVEVCDALWLDQMLSMRAVLERELARIANVRVAGIHFEVKKHGGARSAPKRMG
jgi:hypothetical protein